eukprot:NODE_3_length_80033_cov_0.932970.p7 type:complete len:590 gc:universal NODE_3_length_80033_cov_0.932970:16560-18329(+)
MSRKSQTDRVYPESSAREHLSQDGHLKWEGNLYTIQNGKWISNLVQVFSKIMTLKSILGTRRIIVSNIIKITKIVNESEESRKYQCEIKLLDECVVFASPKEHVILYFMRTLTKLLISEQSKESITKKLLDSENVAISKSVSIVPEKIQTNVIRIKQEYSFKVGSLEDLRNDGDITYRTLKSGPRKARQRNNTNKPLETGKVRNIIGQSNKKISGSEKKLQEMIAFRMVSGKPEDEELEDYIEPSTLKEELEFITNVDWAFVWSIFNIKPFFVPVTKRKIFLYILYILVGTFLSGFTVLPSAYDILAKFCSINAALLLVQFLMIDPSVVLACVLLCRYPPLPKKQRSNKENPTIGLIITCHKSADAITETLKAALVHLEPQNIFIADNGNQKEPMDNTRSIIKGLDPRINYRWNNIGNKTLAQYLAVRDIDRNRKDIEHILIIDDDVTISAHLRFPVERIEGNTKALVIGIRGVDNKGKQKVLWTKWQDMEYKVSDFVKIFQDQYCSVMYPHGAISLWDKKILLQILVDHDAIFYADDVKMGMWLTRRGYRLGYYADAVVDTETPETILGPSPNYYNQRVRSWDFAEHM